MDEINTIAAEQTADQQDAFLEGWGADDFDTADQPEEATAPEAETDAPADQPEQTEGADSKGETAQSATGEAQAEVPEQEAAVPSWTLKHMGAERTMTAAEVTPELLQKGLDYDRVREKYDEAKPVMSIFTEFAEKAGMTVPDYVAFIRAEAKKAAGMTEEEAKRAVALEDREAAVSAKEAAQQEAENAQNEQQQRITADLAEFARAFPDVYDKARSDPKVIPQAVWADVNTGKLSLTSAYAKWAVSEAQRQATAEAAKAETAAQSAKNTERTTGSMKSAGSDTKNLDPFLAGWNS